jgi:phosphoribosylanthranilate isomerase
VAEVKARYGLPVMKAMGVADEGDLAGLLDYEPGAADQILIDAKPPKGAVLPGGNGLAFDWRLVGAAALAEALDAGRRADARTTWREAIRLTNARQVDVSSGVESAPGVKDPARIAAFGYRQTDRQMYFISEIVFHPVGCLRGQGPTA